MLNTGVVCEETEPGNKTDSHSFICSVLSHIVNATFSASRRSYRLCMLITSPSSSSLPYLWRREEIHVSALSAFAFLLHHTSQRRLASLSNVTLLCIALSVTYALHSLLQNNKSSLVHSTLHDALPVKATYAIAY